MHKNGKSLACAWAALALLGTACSTAGGSRQDPSSRYDPDAVESALTARIDEFRKCYKDYVKRASVRSPARPVPRGRVVVHFIIAPDGKTRNADIRESDLDVPDIEGCLVRTMEKVEFPPPKMDGIVEVSYPFTFK